jgi:hypothetical protein
MPLISHRLILILSGLVWITACFGGSAILIHYSTTPAQTASAPARWPAASRLTPLAGKPTLVVAVHPHCPCTRASLIELNDLMLSLGARVKTYVLIVKPEGVGEAWEDTDILSGAKRIPGVTVKIDDKGAEAALFGARTSGQALLYDAQGRLLFNGGITASRGHVGDNEGLRRIVSLVKTGKADKNESLVFGCALGAKSCPMEKAVR